MSLLKSSTGAGVIGSSITGAVTGDLVCLYVGVGVSASRGDVVVGLDVSGTRVECGFGGIGAEGVGTGDDVGAVDAGDVSAGGVGDDGAGDVGAGDVRADDIGVGDKGTCDIGAWDVGDETFGAGDVVGDVDAGDDGAGDVGAVDDDASDVGAGERSADDVGACDVRDGKLGAGDVCIDSFGTTEAGEILAGLKEGKCVVGPGVCAEMETALGCAELDEGAPVETDVGDGVTNAG